MQITSGTEINRQTLTGNRDIYIQFLNQQKNQSFFCCPYPGNPGDRLIRRGTLQLLTDLDVKTTNDQQQADILLFPGGCPTIWPDVMDLIVKTLENYPDKKIVIGPATFEFGFTDWPDIFSRYANRIAGLFCRDNRSYQNLTTAELPETIVQGLSHDPAIYLKNFKWLEELKSDLSEEYILVALRRDKEMLPSAEERLTRKIMPLLSEKKSAKILHWAKKSAKLHKLKDIRKSCARDLPIRDVEIWLLDDSQYLQTICGAKEVHTDRLHVMIVAAMLGKKVFAYKTLYGKLENVYEHSLKGWADVTFVDA
jgi:exopolysaccharide biosynthesis predicted pyruvyltransferase EpsI